MCGICGIVSNSEKIVPDESMIRKMMKDINHRGPDENGCFVEGKVALGHTRLSIIDLSSGRQPIFNEDGSKCIIFNGEIYNYQEIRKNLLMKGHRFKTKSDTEVILHLYEEDGKECVKKLRGMFAFAIWDKERQILFIARDRLGIKPVYYTVSNERLCFASEIKSILASGLVDRELNVRSLDQYIALNYTIGPETLMKKVYKLMPGTILTFENGRVKTEEYWDFNQIPETTESYKDCYLKIQSLIEESIKIRLMSEVPLGAFLSGGVDSSVTVGIMTKLTGKPVKTFTVGYEGAEEFSELKYARIVANHFKSEHHEFILKPKRFMDIVKRVVWHLDEPLAERATIPLLLLSELAKKHVTVMLSGEGADEVFAGYPIYRYMNYIENYQRIPKSVRRNLLDPIAKSIVYRKREGKYADWITQPLNRRFVGTGSNFTGKMRDKLYTEEIKEIIDRTRMYNLIDSYYQKVRDKDAIRKMVYLDTKTWLPEDLLIKADKMTMAASLELRVPFLDHKLVEYATSLPSKMKANLKTSKYIFKKYAETILPKEIVHRKKQGFPVPDRLWLRRELKPIAKEILFDSRTQNRGFFRKKYIENIFQRHISGNEDFSKNIWNLVILEIWLRMNIDGDSV